MTRTRQTIVSGPALQAALAATLLVGPGLLWGRGPARAGSLPLPVEAKAVKQQIADRCPECLERGLVPCGRQDIGFGNRFFKHLFAGRPARGMLVGHTIAPERYVDLLRKHPRAQAVAKLRAAFAATPLFVIEKTGYRVHTVPKPASVEVVLTERLHACLHGSVQPLCCCCAGCEDECCEKKLGSTHVELTWKDPQHPERSLVYDWYPHPGMSRLHAQAADGRRRGTRWCPAAAGGGRLE